MATTGLIAKPESIGAKPLLRVSTAGSVDDGKSSLIGRLLYDSKSIFEDQLEAIERASTRRGSGEVELALLTDGLRAEREQNITIDVAYRYFSTPKRKFILADTPGHEQYTRNMVTGTSRSDVSIVLLDARKGVLPQSKRHSAISSLLGIKVLMVAVNKMDLVGYAEERFEQIRRDFIDQTSTLKFDQIEFFPISALNGDNIVSKGPNLDWFEGSTLLDFLEIVEPPSAVKTSALRIAVQYVVRPDQDFRGFSGQIEAGSIAQGDQVLLLPSQRRATVSKIFGPNGPEHEMHQGAPVVVAFHEHVDLSRGDAIVSITNPPTTNGIVKATVAWMHPDPAVLGKRYTILHANRQVAAHIIAVESKISIDELRDVPADRLELNDIGRIILETSQPLHFDSYESCRPFGSFVFVDPASSITLGAGMILGADEGGNYHHNAVKSQYFRVNGGTAGERKEAVESLQDKLRAQGSAVVSVSYPELISIGLPSTENALNEFISVLDRSKVGLVIDGGGDDPNPSVTLSRFYQQLWVNTHVWDRRNSIQAFVEDALNGSWSPVI